MTENPRTTSARDHDDHAMIDAAVEEADTGAVATSSGGHLQQDVGSEDDLAREVSDPERRTAPTKQRQIDNDQDQDDIKPRL